MHQKYLFVLFVFISLIGLDCYAQHRPTIDRTLLDVKPTTLKFSCGGGTRKIDVKSGSEWNFSVSDASWCHVAKSSNSLNLSVDENITNTLRKVTIKVSNTGKSVRMISVSQEPSTGTKTNAASSQQDKNRIFSVSPNNKRFDADGGTQTMIVTGSTNWRIGVNVASWAHLDKNGNNLTLTVDRNSSTSSRTDYFTLKSGDKTFRVDFSQDGQSSTPFSASPNNKRFGADGGTQTMSVTGSTNWTIGVNVASWAHLNKNGNNLTLTVDRNSSTSSRTDYFILKSGDKTFRVDFSQDGQPSIPFSVSPNNKRFGAEGGTQTMTVTGSSNWSIDLNVASWAHLSKSGNDLTLSVDRNSSTWSRSDYFVLKSGENEFRVDFSQEGQPEIPFSVSPNNKRFGAGGGTQTMTVAGSANWDIVVDAASWAHLNKNGNNLTLTVDRNSSTSSRSDHFTLRSGEKTFRVDFSQDGQVSLMSDTKNISGIGNSGDFGGNGLFAAQPSFASHFWDLQIALNVGHPSDGMFVGASYSHIGSHIGFRISGMSDILNTRGISLSSSVYMASWGPVIRFTSSPSKVDFQAYFSPAYYNTFWGIDAGVRFAWESKSRLSLWDFTLGISTIAGDDYVNFGLGVGIISSPLIGLGALICDDLVIHPTYTVPHHFVDCNVGCSLNTNKFDYVCAGMSYDWNPDRVGTHASVWYGDDFFAGILGVNFRLFKVTRLFDIQLYGGSGISSATKLRNGEIGYYNLAGDFGLRFNFESHRGFSWYDITLGGIYLNGGFYPTIGCGICLSGAVAGIGWLAYLLK